jgi:dephospho-CoA kinase
MKVVALTGSFGAGKTSVLKFVHSMRLPTINSDAIVARLYREEAVQKKLLKAFGTFSKKELAKTIFSSPGKRRKLESILHPLAWNLIKARLASFKKRDKALVFVEVPLLFEAGWQKRFDKAVFVKCSRKACLKRLALKGISKEEAVLRFRAQLSQEKKIKKAHHIIDNSGSLASTKKQVRLLVEKLVERNA